MNIYLPMKNDLLDKGAGTIWTGGGGGGKNLN